MFLSITNSAYSIELDYSTNSNDYLFYDNFNRNLTYIINESQYIGQSLTGQYWREIDEDNPLSFMIVNQSLNQPNSQLDIFACSNITIAGDTPLYNFTFEGVFNYTSLDGLKDNYAMSIMFYSTDICTGTRLGRIGWFNGAFIGGDATSDIISGLTPELNQNYLFRVSFDVTNKLVNYTVYNITNGVLSQGFSRNLETWNSETNLRAFAIVSNYNTKMTGAYSDVIYIYNGTIPPENIPVYIPEVNVSINTSYIMFGDAVFITANVSSGIELDYCWLYDNVTNSNHDLTEISGLNAQCNFTFITNASENSVYEFIVYANNTQNNIGNGSELLNVINSPPYGIPYLNYSSEIYYNNFTFSVLGVSDIDTENILYYEIYYNFNSTSLYMVQNSTINYLSTNFTLEGFYYYNVRVFDGSEYSINSTLFIYEYNIPFIFPTFNATNTTTRLNYEECPQETQGILVLVIAFVLAFAVIFIGVKMSKFVGMFGGLILIVASAYYLACSLLMGVLMILAGITVIIAFVMSNKRY
jgi:hypothetical protein